MSVVQIAEEHVKKNDALRVEVIELEIGELAGIQPEAFEFAWPSAVSGTVLHHARKEIYPLPGAALCTECNCAFALHHLFDNCPDCGSYFYHIRQGKEMRVKSLTLSY